MTPVPFNFSLRALLIVLALFWIVAPGNPYWMLLLLNLAFLATIIHTRDQLPDRVASHFRFDFQADGWMRRRTYLILIGAMGAGLSLFIVVLAMILHRQADFMARHVVWAACAMTGLLGGVHALTVQANRHDPARLPKMFWALLAAFQVAMLLWVATIVTHDRWGWPN